MQSLLRWLNPRRRLVRWPMKLVLFALVIIAVSFPNPVRLARNVEHWSHIDDMTQPDEPALQPWVEAIRTEMVPGQPDKQTLAEVQAFVLQHVPYEWDWNTWGNADYLPTLKEILAMHPIREDCDGRALVAASILRKLGYDARIVTDMKHVWVWTPQGETMGPGGQKLVGAGKHGARFNWVALINTPANAAFGIAVFPWVRELVVVLAAWLLLLAARPRWPAAVGGFVLLVGGWLAFRLMCLDPWHKTLLPVAGAWLGWLLVVVGVVVTAASARPRRSIVTPP